MPEQQVTVTIDVPEGYEATGEYRPAQPGEVFLTETGGAYQTAKGTTLPVFIVRRAKPKTVVVELPREVAELYARTPPRPGDSPHEVVIAACYAALAAEARSEQP